MASLEDTGERRRAARLTDEDLHYLRLFIAREQTLEKARRERGHYKAILIESAIRWAIPVALSALLGLALWTSKLWILAALSAARDVQQ